MSLLAHRWTARAVCGIRSYAVARPNPRPKDPVLRSPHAQVQEIAPNVTFIHNPPSSVPSAHSLTTAPASPLLAPRAGDTGALPPALHSAKAAQGPRLSQAQIEEIKQLRYEDPKSHSCQILARRYGCTPLFVSMIAPLGQNQREELERKQREIEGKWGERKQLIRAIRRKRREFW